MDFKELLNVADYNKAEARSEASVKRYSSVLPPPKKLPKPNVQSENIRRFLERKKAEEAAKVVEARKLKEQLLALRAQNTKSNKKAKIMASRTKDNDFSKIKLTEDEIAAKKKVEEALVKKNLADKVERMKIRIEIEEREKLLPKKRKRKSKHVENVNDDHIPPADDKCFDERRDSQKNNVKHSEHNSTIKTNGIKKPLRPPPPIMSFSELLKVAEKKMHEPIEIPVRKKVEEKLMTKKERKQMEEEQERLRRKQELMQKSTESACSTKSVNSQLISKKNMLEKGNESKITKKPVVIHVEKDSRTAQESPKFKIPQTNCDLEKKAHVIKNVTDKSVNSRLKTNPSKLNSNVSEKEHKMGVFKDQKKPLKPKMKDLNSTTTVVDEKRKVIAPKKKEQKVTPANQNVPLTVNEDMIAAIERRIREKIEKEMEAKLAARFALNNQNLNSSSSTEKKVTNIKNCEKAKQPSELNKTSASVVPKVEKSVTNQPLVPKKNLGNVAGVKRETLMQKPIMPKPPIEKRPFHKNPYLDPPRRLLEPQRPPKPVLKRRIESDDEDEDDMSDFIDDGPSQNDEDYSKYIKEIFGYDRNKYADCDDDEVLESSFSEQMKEEIRSARLGYLEDLEEERLQEIERKRKKKLKK